MRGNLVLSPFVLREVIARQADRPARSSQCKAPTMRTAALWRWVRSACLSTEAAPGTPFWRQSANCPSHSMKAMRTVREAELRLARDLRLESAWKDSPLARWVDRRLSWRISYRLAHTPVTPNQVTLAGTALGLLSAWLFAFPGYWPRLAAAVLLMVAITLDGVDGELARLKLAESRLGAQLDTVGDTLVNIAIFGSILTGCYRASGSIPICIWSP